MFRRAIYSVFTSTRSASLQNRATLFQNSARAMSSPVEYNFETLAVTRPAEFVVQVELNRPAKRNAMNITFWSEMTECFSQLSTDQDCRAIVLSAAGKIYTAGLDLMDFSKLLIEMEVGRRAIFNREFIIKLQNSLSAIEKCPKPVIAAIHNACIGGGVDMISACDIRYCTKDAYFQVKEVDLGLAADIGTLQRLPKVMGNDSLVRELAYTGRKLESEEAKSAGLVSAIFEDRDAVIAGALQLAGTISEKSPIAVQGTKVNLVYSRDHSVSDGLDYVATWNQGMLQSEDLVQSVMAAMQKQKATFAKL